MKDYWIISVILFILMIVSFIIAAKYKYLFLLERCYIIGAGLVAGIFSIVALLLCFVN